MSDDVIVIRELIFKIYTKIEAQENVAFNLHMHLKAPTNGVISFLLSFLPRYHEM